MSRGPFSLSFEPLGDLPLPALEGPEERRIRTGDVVRVTDLISPDALWDPLARDAAVCRLAYLPSSRDVVREEEMDDALRERLRALGYFH